MLAGPNGRLDSGPVVLFWARGLGRSEDTVVVPFLNRLRRISCSPYNKRTEKMAAFCNFLQIPFSINPKPSSVSPHRSSAPSFHPRRPFPLCLFSTRPPSSPLISSNLEKPFPWIEPVESIVPTDPSLRRHANILFFRSAYNVQIADNEDEPDVALLRRFRREVSKAGVIQECKRRRYFENSHEEKKRKAREAGKTNRRR